MAILKAPHGPAVKGAVKCRAVLATAAGQGVMRLRSGVPVGTCCHPGNLRLGANLDLWLRVVLTRPWFNLPRNTSTAPMGGGYKECQEIPFQGYPRSTAGWSSGPPEVVSKIPMLLQHLAWATLGVGKLEPHTTYKKPRKTNADK